MTQQPPNDPYRNSVPPPQQPHWPPQAPPGQPFPQAGQQPHPPSAAPIPSAARPLAGTPATRHCLRRGQRRHEELGKGETHHLRHHGGDCAPRCWARIPMVDVRSQQRRPGIEHYSRRRARRDERRHPLANLREARTPPRINPQTPASCSSHSRMDGGRRRTRRANPTSWSIRSARATRGPSCWPDASLSSRT